MSPDLLNCSLKNGYLGYLFLFVILNSASVNILMDTGQPTCISKRDFPEVEWLGQITTWLWIILFHWKVADHHLKRPYSGPPTSNARECPTPWSSQKVGIAESGATRPKATTFCYLTRLCKFSLSLTYILFKILKWKGYFGKGRREGETGNKQKRKMKKGCARLLPVTPLPRLPGG